MKNLILGALVVLAAACGGGGKPQLLDAAVDSQFACNPVAQTGCKAGEKCTWIVDIDGTMTTNEVGHIGCAPVGATPTADGAACADAVAATNGGVDTCAAGDLCISRKCKPICDPQTAAGVAGSCKTDFACTTYAGVFDFGASALAGVCEPTCDPLTQRLKVGTTGIEACGSADPTKPTAACVFGPDEATWVCAPSGSILYGKTDRQPPLTDPVSGHPFPNGCAPGFVPLFFDGSGSMTTLCTGLCAPLKTDNVISKTTGHANDNEGDPTALAKLTADPAPVAGNGICVKDKKGAGDVTTAIGEDCRFYWWPIFNQDPTKATPNDYNDKLGFCFEWQKFKDLNMQPLKSCADLPPAGATANDASAANQGCYPVAQSNLTAPTAEQRRAMPQMRFGYPREPLTRHVFD